MQKAAIYGIIAAVVVAAGVGIAFAAMSGNNAGTDSQLTSEQTSNDNQVRVIEHDMGETEIRGTPERIVALAPPFQEHLLLLGVKPAGISESGTMRVWYPDLDEQLPDVVDLGDYPPNLELIAEMEPDLIIGPDDSYMEFYEDLNEIAPTLLFNDYPAESTPTQLQAMEQNFMAIADLLNKHDEGVAVIDRMHAKIDEGAAEIEAAGLKGHKVIFAETGVWEEEPWMGLMLPNSKVANILEEMGLESPVEGEFDKFGRAFVGLEALASLDGPDVHFVYVTALGDPIFEGSQYWGEHPVWTQLEFVQNERVHHLDKVLINGGPQQSEQLVDKVLEALTSESQ
jgi:ABC-type Fe3+-hydroxamate transport system substrate-binding protein